MEYALTTPAGWTPPQNATLLARISADIKRDQHGVEGQIRELRGFARDIGAHIKTVVQENNKSGYKEYETTENGRTVLRTRRPDLQEILREARAGRTDGLLVAMDDRLGRNERDAADLVEIVRLSRPGGHNSDTIPRFQVFSSDGSVNLLTEDGCQAYLNRIAAHRAYCDSIRKKVTRSHRLRAKDGIYHGGAYHGYVIDHSAPGRLRKAPADARVIRRMADMILAGDSAQDVVRDLTARKVPVPFKRGAWDHYMVRDILLSPIVAGRSVYRGEDVADGLWERIISREEQDQIERMLDYPRRPTYHHKPRVTHLGSGLYRCGMPECDGLMWANSMAVVPERYAGRERGYSCRVCGGQRRRISWVDGVVVDQIVKRLADPRSIHLLDRVAPDNEPEIAEIGARFEELERQSREFRRLRREGLLRDYEADEELDDIRRERATLSARLTEIQPRDDRTHPAEGIAGRPDAAELWNDLSPERKRDIIAEIAVVKVGPAMRHGRTPNGAPPDRENIWVTFKGDRPARREITKTRDSAKDTVRKILTDMFDSRDSIPTAEGRPFLEAKLREAGYGFNHMLVCEVRAELGIIARQVSGTGWEWAKLPSEHKPGVCEGCGKEFSGYRTHQRFCSGECRLAAWKAGQGAARKSECEECGKEYRSWNSGHRFCSTECRRAVWLRARGPVRNASPVHGNAARNCEQCGGEFQPYRKTTRFCSEECRLAARRKS